MKQGIFTSWHGHDTQGKRDASIKTSSFSSDNRESLIESLVLKLQVMIDFLSFFTEYHCFCFYGQDALSTVPKSRFSQFPPCARLGRDTKNRVVFLSEVRSYF